MDSFPDFPETSGERLVQVFCQGFLTRPFLNRMFSEVVIPTTTENSVERPVPGTYSSEPALTELTITPGTLGPAFEKQGFLYSVLDLQNENEQVTLTASAKAGYSISWNPDTDADPNTDGHQVNLEVGYNSIFISVDHDQGVNSFVYEVIVKRPEASQQQSDNTPATGAPGIAGTAQVGQTLTASTTGINDADGLDDVSYNYQWIRNDGTTDTDISGANASTYELVDADQGKTIKVKVSFEDDDGNSETLTSAATATVAARPNNAATGVPTITGTAQVGQTLTADTSGIVDADGLDDVSYSYQWIRSDEGTDSDIAGATGSTYVLVRTDQGKTVKVNVSFTDDRNNQESLTSTATTTVAARPNNPATGAPTITGTAQVGQTLTASTSGIADADGLDDVSYNYQWVRNDGTTDADIGGATGSTYELVVADQGNTVKVRVTFTDDWSNSESLTSAVTSAVAARPNNAATGAPTISGTAQVGEILTASTSGIADADGLDDVSYNYQWIRNDGTTDSDIAGATGSTYELVDADQGKTIKVKVSFADDWNNQESLTSAATGAVAARPPLTAAFESTPASHDGTNSFTFELHFSEEVKLSFKALRDHGFQVTGGTITRAKRLDKPSNIRWEIHVQPSGNGDMTIALPKTTDCDDDGAVCTEDGRKLSNRNQMTVSGPGG